MKQMSEIGIEALKFQEELAAKKRYKKLRQKLSDEVRIKYIEELPEDFAQGKKGKLITLDGTLIANGYERVVIGDYGAFVEIHKKDIIHSNIKVKRGQEYRMLDERFSKNVKYFWLTAKDRSDCKLYHQQKEVTYADYKGGGDFYYVSPYEVEII